LSYQPDGLRLSVMFYPRSGKLEKLCRFWWDQPDESVGDRSDVSRHEPGTGFAPAVTVDQQVRISDAPEPDRDRDQPGDEPAIHITVNVVAAARSLGRFRPASSWAKPTLEQTANPSIRSGRGRARVYDTGKLGPMTSDPALSSCLVEDSPGDSLSFVVVQQRPELGLDPLADHSLIVRWPILMGLV